LRVVPWITPYLANKGGWRREALAAKKKRYEPQAHTDKDDISWLADMVSQIISPLS
jgi:hypothetical protein